MQQLPSQPMNTEPQELNFFRDWEKSVPLVIEAVKAKPIPAICCAAAIAAQFFLAFIPGWGLLQAVAMLYVVSAVFQTTYGSVIPEAAARPELFPNSPESRMLGITIILNIGAGIGIWFFVFPAIWIWLVHYLALPITVLEGTGVFDSMAKSRELMKGNMWRIIKYVYCWPVLISIGIFAVAIVGAILASIVGGPFFQSDSGKELLKNLIITLLTIIFTGLGLSFQSLSVRAYVKFMHEAGQRTAIEQKLTNSIAPY
jgi:hypothetical protein